MEITGALHAAEIQAHRYLMFSKLPYKMRNTNTKLNYFMRLLRATLEEISKQEVETKRDNRQFQQDKLLENIQQFKDALDLFDREMTIVQLKI